MEGCIRKCMRKRIQEEDVVTLVLRNLTGVGYPSTRSGGSLGVTKARKRGAVS